ncbi:hypothetical protein Tco_1211591 [Tanacetum coccineum]
MKISQNPYDAIKPLMHSAEVNSRAKVQSPKTRNNIKPIEKITNVIKPKRWISKGYRVYPNKSSVVHEKPNTPRSYLRWIPTGRIFKLAGLRWIPTRKMFIIDTTKVDSEPPNGSNEDITNPYQCDHLLMSVQAPLLKEKKGVRFSALYLQKKRNILDYIKMEMQIPHSSKVKFIAICSYSRLNDFITSRKNDPKLPQNLISTSSSVCQSDEVMN